jgi:hypothetical protein
VKSHDQLSIIVAGMVAGQPGQAGAAWAVLHDVLGLRALGHKVTLVEPVTVPSRRITSTPAACCPPCSTRSWRQVDGLRWNHRHHLADRFCRELREGTDLI